MRKRRGPARERAAPQRERRSGDRPDYARLPTEALNPRAIDLELRPAEDIVTTLVREEARAQRAALSARKQIARAVEHAVLALRSGGRLFYCGAGTSGRLGALDAAELPPTFGSDPGQVVAVVAGGPRALQRSVEGAEDRAAEAEERLTRHRLRANDVVCAIAASGVTTFARAALAFARRRGARTIFVTCVRAVEHERLADVVIAVPVGPEVLAGSTRLKAGTATKIVLNAISTATMIKLGKVYKGRMVDVLATNQKLRDRARRIVCELTGTDGATAQALLKRASGRPKLAVAIHALGGVPASEAAARLELASGDLHRLLDSLKPRRRR